MEGIEFSVERERYWGFSTPPGGFVPLPFMILYMLHPIIILYYEFNVGQIPQLLSYIQTLILLSLLYYTLKIAYKSIEVKKRYSFKVSSKKDSLLGRIL